MAVREGAPEPDIGSVEALKRALLAAKSIAYSDSASGVYISSEMFQRLGVADALAGKAGLIPPNLLAQSSLAGRRNWGFQQMSELKPIPGIDIVGPLPSELQRMTIFSAGIVTDSSKPEEAKALIAFLVARRSGRNPRKRHGANRSATRNGANGEAAMSGERLVSPSPRRRE